MYLVRPVYVNIDTVRLPRSIIDHMEGVDDFGANLRNVSDGTLPHHLATVEDSLGSDGAPDTELCSPDHTELLGHCHVLAGAGDVVTRGADVGGEHDIPRHLGTVHGHQLELERLGPGEEGVAQVAMDAHILHQIAQNILHIVLTTHKREHSAEVEMEPGEVSWLSQIAHSHVHQDFSVLTKLCKIIYFVNS